MKKNEDISSSKILILKSALEIVEKDGFEKLTIRKIVEKTGKNLNAINYYYGSKDKLEIEIIKYFFDIVYNEFFILKMEKCTMEEFLNIYCEMMIKNRGLFKKIFSCLISENLEIVEKVSIYVNGKIGEAVKKIKNSEFESCEDKMRYFQKMAAVIYPVLIIEGVEKMFGFNLENEEERKKYINILTKN